MPTPERRAPRTQGQERADPEGAPGFRDHRSWHGWRPEAVGQTTRNQDVSLTQRIDLWKASSRVMRLMSVSTRPLLSFPLRGEDGGKKSSARKLLG